MLKQPERSLHYHVFEDGAWRDVDRLALGSHNNDGALERHATAKVDRTGDGEMVELHDLRDRRNARLEARHLLKVAAELDEGSRAESVRVHNKLTVRQSVEVRLDEHKVGARLDRQEASPGHVDTVSILEVADGSTDSRLELEDGHVCLALLICRDGLAVGDDLHGKLVVLNHALDRLEAHPDVVGVEVLELLDGLELIDMLLGYLRNFEQTHRAFVIDDGTTLDISLGFVRQLHDVLGFGVHHVLENTEIDDGAQVVGVGEEDVFNAAVNKLVENARVVQRLEDVTVAWRVPVGNVRISRLGRREQ